MRTTVHLDHQETKWKLAFGQQSDKAYSTAQNTFPLISIVCFYIFLSLLSSKIQYKLKFIEFKVVLKRLFFLENINLNIFMLLIVLQYQKPSGHGPRQPVLGGPARAGGMEKMTSRSPFQPQPFCDAVTHNV